MKTAWAIMPFIDLWDEYTFQAAEDVLGQEGVGDVRLLLVANDCTSEELQKAEDWVATKSGSVLLWNHRPALPALGSTWNTALKFCWEAGVEEALVVNNDVRLHRGTHAALKSALWHCSALFVSAVGVTEEQFDPGTNHELMFNEMPHPDPDPAEPQTRVGMPRGGPDYSCFLISKECHEQFPFDPELTYFGDNDHHRSLKLAGEGERIFSVNIPYLHFSSATINRSPEAKAEGDRAFRAHKDYYIRKWGGAVGEESFETPFGAVKQ